MSCSVCAGYSSQNCPCCGGDYRMVTCPDCNGTGRGPYMLQNIRTRGIIVTDFDHYYLFPRDEEMARMRGENVCRLPRGLCRTCHGDGEIPEEY